MEAISQAGIALGILAKDGIVIAAEKKREIQTRLFLSLCVCVCACGCGVSKPRNPIESQCAEYKISDYREKQIERMMT